MRLPPLSLCLLATLLSSSPLILAALETPTATWSFAVSGDSRNCGDFVMPAIAAHIQAEHDAFYWHLGDFRWMTHPDQDLIAMDHSANPFTQDSYQLHAW